MWAGSFQQMMEDLRVDPPAYVVDASNSYNFALGQYAMETFPELAEWLSANYVFDFQVFGREGSAMKVYRHRDREPTDVSEPIERTIPGHPGRFASG